MEQNKNLVSAAAWSPALIIFASLFFQVCYQKSLKEPVIFYVYNTYSKNTKMSEPLSYIFYYFSNWLKVIKVEYLSLAHNSSITLPKAQLQPLIRCITIPLGKVYYPQTLPVLPCDAEFAIQPVTAFISCPFLSVWRYGFGVRQYWLCIF